MILWRDQLALAALALVPALALVLAWARRRRRRDLAIFVEAGLLPVVVPDLDLRRRTLRAALLVLATGLLVVALAGPMWGFRWEQVRREGVDLVIALDTSRSMLATDVKPSRLGRAKLAVRELVSQLAGDRVALVAFAGSAFVQCPLTLDYGAVAESLDAIEVGIIPKGGTALAAALDAALDAFEGHEGRHQAVVLITDGEDHEGKVKEAAGRAASRGVKVYAVGIGTGEGELIPGESGGFLKDRSGQVVKSRLDEETLEQIAVDTGGVYLHAAGTALGLTDLYRDYIGKMEKREVASTLERRYAHRFQIPLAFAFLLLLLEPLVGERRRAEPGRRWRRWGRTADAQARLRLLAVVVVAASSLGWLDPHDGTRQANRLYAAGKYEDAAAKYNQALVDHPDSPLLHFNLGDAVYKQGKYADAVSAFEQVPGTADDPARTARVAYNVGNAKYRLGEAAETSDPKAALALYAEALAAYRRAMGAAPGDLDAKVNHEFVTRKLEALKKKLEEQQKQAQEQEREKQQEKQGAQDEQQQDHQPQDEQRQDAQHGNQPEDEQQAQQGQEQQEQQQAQSPEADQPQAGESPKERGQEQAAEKPAESEGAGQQADAQAAPKKAQAQAAPEASPPGGAAEGAQGTMSRKEATALLDSQRDQEVRPEDIVRRLQGAVVAEPAQDW